MAGSSILVSHAVILRQGTGKLPNKIVLFTTQADDVNQFRWWCWSWSIRGNRPEVLRHGDRSAH